MSSAKSGSNPDRGIYPFCVRNRSLLVGDRMTPERAQVETHRCRANRTLPF